MLARFWHYVNRRDLARTPLARRTAALDALDRIATPIPTEEAGLLVNGAPVDLDHLPPDHPTVTVTEPVELGPGGPYLFDDPDR